MNKLLYVCALGLMGCGSNPPAQFDTGPFQSYYQAFSVAGNVQTNNLIMKFGTLGTPGPNPNTFIIGECEYGATNTVVIDQVFWSSASEGTRTELIWHELGHCILNRVHRTDLLSNGYPASIMNPILFDSNIIQINYEYYREEMFGK